MGLKCFSNTAIFKDHVFAKRLSKKENRLHERPKNAHTRTKFKDSLCYRFIQIEEIFWKEIPRKKKKCNLRKLKLSSVRFARYLQYIISGTEIGGKEHPQQKPSFINIFTRPCSSPRQDSSVITHFKLGFTSV